MNTTIGLEDFLSAATDFVHKSDQVGDGWVFKKDTIDEIKSYLKKDSFVQCGGGILKVEYVVFYNLSYGVPAFSFNLWNSSGCLVSLEDIRNMAFISINQKDFYSVITQQEHPIFQRPYFIVHPCHTEEMLAAFKNRTKNIIVTFLGIVAPLVKLNLPLEYGLLVIEKRVDFQKE